MFYVSDLILILNSLSARLIRLFTKWLLFLLE